MKVALFSDVITWIGEADTPDANPAPDTVEVDDGESALPAGSIYTNLALQGGSSLLETHPKFRAAYVLNPDADNPSATLRNIKLLAKPISTEGA